MIDVQAVNQEHQVAPEAGKRLDRALADILPDLSRSRIKNLILNGLVSTAGVTITDPSYTVKPSEVFDIKIPQVATSKLTAEKIPLRIIFEDTSLLVIDKQAGLTVHPGAGQPSGTLVNALLAHCGESLSGVGGVKRPGIVDQAHVALSAQFEARTVERAYLAVVWGVPTPRLGVIEGNIGRSRRNRTKMAVVSEGRGKRALTRYRTLAVLSNVASLVECRLGTGRTHQIRVHMTHIGHPLVGDTDYARKTSLQHASHSVETSEAIKNLGRQALHAAELGFEHPESGERMHFTTPLPADMELLEKCFNSDKYFA